MPKSEPTGFAINLKRYREAAGLTQEELAERIGAHKFTIAKLEQGVNEPGWTTVLQVAKALNVTPNDFIVTDKEIKAFSPAMRGRPTNEEPAPKKRGRPRKKGPNDA